MLEPDLVVPFGAGEPVHDDPHATRRGGDDAIGLGTVDAAHSMRLGGRWLRWAWTTRTLVPGMSGTLYTSRESSGTR
jgi:hypothetical protein